MSFSELVAARCQREFCIPVNEDYDFRHLIWFPTIVEQEIENFWASQESFEWAPDDCLDGKWFVQVEANYHEFGELFTYLWHRPNAYAIAFDGNLPGALYTPNGRAIFHKGVKADDSERSLFEHWALERMQRSAELEANLPEFLQNKG
jgi:hypothetical protein